MRYMQYEEFQVPEEMQQKLADMSEAMANDQSGTVKPATLHRAGVFEWITNLSKEGWTPVWAAFVYPFLVFEREVNDEEM